MYMGTEILRMENITKIYSNGFAANKNVTFSVNAGEIHALAAVSYTHLTLPTKRIV